MKKCHAPNSRRLECLKRERAPDCGPGHDAAGREPVVPSPPQTSVCSQQSLALLEAAICAAEATRSPPAKRSLALTPNGPTGLAADTASNALANTYAEHSAQAAVPRGVARSTSISERWVRASTAQGETRFDLPHLTGVNEMILKHQAMPASQTTLPEGLRWSPSVAARVPAECGGRGRGRAPAERVYRLDRASYHLVKALVHPLHNFLQHHCGLHNADEIQLLIPPLARSGSGGAVAQAPQRTCFLATNRETITQREVDAATAAWGVLRSLHIDAIRVVHGPTGRHAEQKLLTFWLGHVQATRIKGRAGAERARSARTPLVPLLLPEERPLIVGERLPCAACAVFFAANGMDRIAWLMPSHGHLYPSTVAGMGVKVDRSPGSPPADDVPMPGVSAEAAAHFSSRAAAVLLDPVAAASLLTQEGKGFALPH